MLRRRQTWAVPFIGVLTALSACGMGNQTVADTPEALITARTLCPEDTTLADDPVLGPVEDPSLAIVAAPREAPESNLGPTGPGCVVLILSRFTRPPDPSVGEDLQFARGMRLVQGQWLFGPETEDCQGAGGQAPSFALPLVQAIGRGDFGDDFPKRLNLDAAFLFEGQSSALRLSFSNLEIRDIFCSDI